METLTETPRPENQGPSTRQKIISAYREYLLLNGRAPASVFAFCQDLDLEESEFYDHFNDFPQVEDAFWTEIFKDVQSATIGDSEFAHFSAREKMLAFYYAFFEKLKQHRSFALVSLEESFFAMAKEERHLTELKKEFRLFAKQIISEGVRNGEVAERSRLSDNYHRVFWFQFLFLLNFWRKDRSRAFTKTEAAIEKSVNLAFDLIEKNALESAFDFGKFMFQNR